MNQLLPHEFVLLARKVVELETEYKELGEQLGEMMRQSSETWHDNGPAQAIEDKSGIVSSRLKTLLKVRKTAKRVGYPKINATRISIGSTVTDMQDNKTTTITIVGDTSIYDSYPSKELPAAKLASASSPLGNVLIGHKINES